MEAGDDVDQREATYGSTALHWAGQHGHPSVVSVLLAAGADVHVVEDKYGSTPLHTAAFNGHVSVCALLLDAGAQVGALNSNALTPLHYAASNDHYEVAKLLLSRGASARARSREGRTPLEKSISELMQNLIFSAQRREEALEAHLVTEKVTAPNEALRAALVKGLASDTATALSRGSDANSPDDEG